MTQAWSNHSVNVPEYTVRHIKDLDRGFVASTWIQNQRGSAIAHQMGMPAWHRYYQPRVDDYIARAVAYQPDPSWPCIMVRCLTADEDAIVGWCAFHDDVLDYVYVKGQARRVGHGAALVGPINSLLRRCSHTTPDAASYVKHLGLDFDPYAFGAA